MQPNDQSFEALWKGQYGGQMPTTANEICAKARALEKKGEREYWLVLVILAACVVKAGFSLFQFSEPLVKAGWVSGIATFLYIAARWARNGPPAKAAPAAQSATCLDYLRSELTKKRERMLELRWTLLLLFPALCLSWWGGGPAAMAHRLGIDFPWVIRFQESPGPLIGQALILLFAWLGFGKEAEKLGRELEYFNTLGGLQ